LGERHDASIKKPPEGGLDFSDCAPVRRSDDPAVLESAGVEFIAENGSGAGVRLKKGG
jgi:hypothetical protein